MAIKEISGLLTKGNDMGLVMMMRVMSSAPSPAVAALDWAHTYFLGIFILFSGAFGRLIISSRHKVKKLKYYIIVLCHGAPKGC